ncbi:sigma factor-like helix-turn-helix DNA-binding protein [Nocardia nova]|uniref:sigma factor-like helix-turn-helix DNA-binding protein n=1 Tax=Nocardia nova TaxID=37330 RepID=UPI001CA5DB17|nr:sigma factor-like helix-turn-helix DNA-binding protein [Nocardia nova]
MDERTFRELTEPYRAELRTHCYRMLGSMYDAEDAVPDALLDPQQVLTARASVELALIALLQQLPPRQAAVLVLRDVLEFNTAEVADMR